EFNAVIKNGTDAQIKKIRVEFSEHLDAYPDAAWEGLTKLTKQDLLAKVVEAYEKGELSSKAKKTKDYFDKQFLSQIQSKFDLLKGDLAEEVHQLGINGKPLHIGTLPSYQMFDGLRSSVYEKFGPEKGSELWANISFDLV